MDSGVWGAYVGAAVLSADVFITSSRQRHEGMDYRHYLETAEGITGSFRPFLFRAVARCL